MKISKNLQNKFKILKIQFIKNLIIKMKQNFGWKNRKKNNKF